MRRRPERGRRPDDAVEVDLVDVPLDPHDPADEGRPPPVDVPAPTRSRGWAAGRRRGVLWSVAALVVVLVVGVNLLEIQREEARRAAVAEHPMALADLSEPWREIWRAPPGLATAVVDEVLVVSGDEALRGLDLRTGEVRWERRLVSAGPWYWDCTRTDGAGSRSPASTGNAGDRLVLCSTRDGGAGGSTYLTAIDGLTGQVQHTLEGTGTLVAREWLGDDVLVSSLTAAGRVHLVRWDPVADVVTWEYESPTPIVGGPGRALQSVHREDDVYVVSGEHTVAVSLSTGEEVPYDPTDEGAGRRDVVALPDGHEAVWTVPVGGARPASGHVLDADGRVRFELPGPVLRPALDDGSVPGVLLVGDPAARRDGLAGAIDAEDGRSLWTFDRLDGYPLVQVAGRVVVISGTSALGLDVRDGTVRWSVPVLDTVQVPPLTDGALIMLPVRSDDGAALAAHDLRDGTQVWRTVLPAGAQWVVGADGRHVVVMTPEALVGVGASAPREPA